MSDLIVVSFSGEDVADQALNRLQALQKEYIVELEDAVVAVRDKNGNRWGFAPDGIYLGKIKLPPVALKPSPGKRDEIAARNRDYNEIEKQAYLEESRSSFKERVQAIRERKDRERAEKRKTEEKPIT